MKDTKPGSTFERNSLCPANMLNENLNNVFESRANKILFDAVISLKLTPDNCETESTIASILGRPEIKLTISTPFSPK